MPIRSLRGRASAAMVPAMVPALMAALPLPLLLLLLPSLQNPAAASARTGLTDVHVMTWNVLVGFRERSQLPAATEWLRGEAPDVLALQELNGFTEASLGEAARGWGHPHAAMAKEHGYPVGLTSRTPIEVVERRLEGLHHGALHARTAGLEVFVVHLHPGDWRFRRREAALLAEWIAPFVAEGRDVVVLGDFNAHHPLDCAHLAGQAPLLARRTEGANLIDGRAFDFGVLARFAEAGLGDAVHRHLGDGAAERGTFPTLILAHAKTSEAQAGFLERIDFVLLSPSARRRSVSAALPRAAVLDEVSDHYPVSVRLTD